MNLNFYSDINMIFLRWLFLGERMLASLEGE